MFSPSVFFLISSFSYSLPDFNLRRIVLFHYSILWPFPIFFFQPFFTVSRPEFTLLVEPPVGDPEYLIAEIRLPGVVRHTIHMNINRVLSSSPFLSSSLYFFIQHVLIHLNSNTFKCDLSATSKERYEQEKGNTVLWCSCSYSSQLEALMLLGTSVNHWIAFKREERPRGIFLHKIWPVFTKITVLKDVVTRII